MESLPIVPLQERTHQGVRQVYDPLRRQWMVWTPEEHVRQCLILHLTHVLGCPATLIGVERGVRYHGLQKRWDLLVHGRDGKPLLLAEVKEPRVEINEDAVMQLATYNSRVQAPHLLLTNGRQLLLFSKGEDGRFALQPQMRDFASLAGEEV